MEAGKELPIDAWELNTEVGDIWSIDESFDDENGEICEEESRIEDEQEYGPSNPWDAPGMSVSDFIRGVH